MRFYFVAFYSALIGGLTHLLLDLPAHKYNELYFPWAVFLVPEILLVTVIDFGLDSTGFGIVKLYDLIWLIEDVIFLGISLKLLRKIKKESLIEKWYANENF